MKFCKYCGETIEDTASTCPKCNANLVEKNEDVAIVYNETIQTEVSPMLSKESEFKKRINKITPFIQKYRKPVLAILAALSLIFIVVAITTITSEDYQECSENYSEYMENYEENLSTSKSYGGYGILGSGYQRVADGWKDLADDMSAKLWELRVQAIIFTIVSVICAVFTIKVYKLPAMVKEQEKNLL